MSKAQQGVLSAMFLRALDTYVCCSRHALAACLASLATRALPHVPRLARCSHPPRSLPAPSPRASPCSLLAPPWLTTRSPPPRLALIAAHAPSRLPSVAATSVRRRP
jgi:hypothetical protein